MNGTAIAAAMATVVATGTGTSMGAAIGAATCATVAAVALLSWWRPDAPRVTRRVRAARTAPGSHGRGGRRRRERRLDQAIPDLFDLFVVSVHAGLSPPEALRHIRTAVDPIVGEALIDLDHRLARGQRFADALDVLVDHLGTRVLTFVSALAAADRTGLALGPALERIADDARRHRRHLLEAEARELPVRLTVPLVLCTLPAFALVAIAPLVIGAISSLVAG